MAWFVRRNLFAGVAGACVVGLGIAMVWPIFSRYGDSRLLDDLQPPVTVELKPRGKDDPRQANRTSRHCSAGVAGASRLCGLAASRSSRKQRQAEGRTAAAVATGNARGLKPSMQCHAPKRSSVDDVAR